MHASGWMEWSLAETFLLFCYLSRKNYPPVKLFEGDIQKTVGEGFVPIKRTLEKEIRGCQDLILWTDGDREGEDIAAEIVDVCKKGEYIVICSYSRWPQN